MGSVSLWRSRNFEGAQYSSSMEYIALNDKGSGGTIEGTLMYALHTGVLDSLGALCVWTKAAILGNLEYSFWAQYQAPRAGFSGFHRSPKFT